MRTTRSRTKRPRGALLQLVIALGRSLCSIAGRLRSLVVRLGGVIGEIPAWLRFDPNRDRLTRRGTVAGGQFDWGGRLLKGSGGAQRLAQMEWKPIAECKGTSQLDCQGYNPSRDESRA